MRIENDPQPNILFFGPNYILNRIFWPNDIFFLDNLFKI